MAQYAYFDHTAPSPSQVRGWIDTTAPGWTAETALPDAADLLTLTADQWAARTTGLWAVQAGTTLVPYTLPLPPIDTRTLAKAELDASDVTVIRCVEHSVSVPAEWTAYRAALRAIVSGTSSTTPLPARPAFPAGT